jgi:tetratricopeptide (TPR) repeat protein
MARIEMADNEVEQTERAIQKMNCPRCSLSLLVLIQVFKQLKIRRVPMRALIVPMAGVCLAFGLQASEWASRQDAAKAAMLQHDYSTAAGLFQGCVSLATTPEDRVTALASEGIALNRANRNAEAKPVLEQALAGLAELKGKTSGADGLVISGVLASADRSLGDYVNAERILRAAGKDPSGTPGTRATLMVNLADLLREESRQTEAGEVLEDANRLPEVPRAQRISVLVEMAELARETHRWQTSVEDWNMVGEIAASEHSRHLEEDYAGGLGNTWFEAGDLARAEPLLRRSLQLLRGDSDSSPSQIAVALSLMARLYIAQNKLALAREALDEAISKDEQALGAEHPQIAMLLEMRAAILSRRGDPQPARDDLEHARIIMTSHFGAESAAVGGVVAALADVEQRANRPAVAATDYGVAIRLLRAAGADSARFGNALVGRYADALKAAHRPDEAKTLLASGN